MNNQTNKRKLHRILTMVMVLCILAGSFIASMTSFAAESKDAAKSGAEASAQADWMPDDWEAKMGENATNSPFPDKNLRAIIKKAMEEKPPLYGPYATTEDALADAEAIDIEVKNNGRDADGNVVPVDGAVTNYEGLQLIGTESGEVGTLTIVSPSADFSLWNPLLGQDVFFEIVIDNYKVINPTPNYTGSSSNVNLPNFMNPTSLITPAAVWTSNDLSLVFIRNNETKNIVLKSGIMQGDGSGLLETEGIIIRNVPDEDYLRLTSSTSNLWNFETNGKSFDLTSKRSNLGQIQKVAFGISFDKLFHYVNANHNAANNPMGYYYQFKADYYSSVNWQVDSSVYSGFKFKKTSSITGEDGSKKSLAGAQYVVSRDFEENGKTVRKYLKKTANGTAVTDDTQAGNFQKEEFTDDIKEALIFTTDQNGEFTVDKIPVQDLSEVDRNTKKAKATYYVTEIKAPEGYKLEASKATPVEVVADLEGVHLTAEGGEGNTMEAYPDEITVRPHWEKGNNQAMTVDEPMETHKATVFIKNKNEGGNDISHLLYTLNGSKHNLQTWQNPKYKVEDLEGNTVLYDISGISDLQNKINSEIIAKNIMQEEKDSYNIVAKESEGSNELIYYDKDWEQNYTDGIAATQENTPLPVNLALKATKVLKGAELSGDEFAFTLTPDENNPGDDPFEDGKTIRNTKDGRGNIDFGQITFTKPGTYAYTLQEAEEGDLAKEDDITYDKAERKVQIDVEEKSDNGVTHGLTATVTVDGKVIGTYTSADVNDVTYAHLDEDGKLTSDNIEQKVKEDCLVVDQTTFENVKKGHEKDPLPEWTKEDINGTSVKTGDSMPILILAAVMTAALLAGLLLLVTRRRTAGR